MTYRLSNRSLNRIKDIDPILIKVLKSGIKNSPFDFGIPRDGGFRTAKRQKELYAKGRTTEGSKVTWTLNSYHMTGKAFDIYAYVDKEASWNMMFLEPIARHLQKVSLEEFNIVLEWGYDLWGKDGAHFQIK